MLRERLEKIAEAFHGEEEVMIIVSPKLEHEIKSELASMNPPCMSGVFVPSNQLDHGFSSVCYNGVTIHYASSMKKLQTMIIDNYRKGKYE